MKMASRSCECDFYHQDQVKEFDFSVLKYLVFANGII
jgi:hypothetical protein